MRTVLMVMMVSVVSLSSRAQSHEAQQLLLNWQKLAQLKGILKNMYKGYDVLSKGYTRIQNIAEGNHTLHKNFLDGLLQVSPVVRKYKKVGDVIDDQSKIPHGQKEAMKYFRGCGSFSDEELAYLTTVYQRLLRESLKTLNELVLVMTSGELRMSDHERIQAIDRIYVDMQDKLHFLYAFNKTTKALSLQRKREVISIELSRRQHGLK